MDSRPRSRGTLLEPRMRWRVQELSGSWCSVAELGLGLSVFYISMPINVSYCPWREGLHVP
jgi:hypothetical protein